MLCISERISKYTGRFSTKIVIKIRFIFVEELGNCTISRASQKRCGKLLFEQQRVAGQDRITEISEGGRRDERRRIISRVP